jgi:2-hydroxychromene-2-carboxylate isomerase
VSAEPAVEFFFSPGSRYSYLAASQISRLERDHGCRVDWRPVRGSEIRAFRGNNPFDGSLVSGQYDWAYRERDARAWADYYAIAYREPPETEFDFDLLALAAAAGKLLGAAGKYGWALCECVYASQTWPVDRHACVALARGCGLSSNDVDRLLDDAAPRDLLAANAREAHQRGAFGVPTFFRGDQMFWGNDRLLLLQHALASAGN